MELTTTDETTEIFEKAKEWVESKDPKYFRSAKVSVTIAIAEYIANTYNKTIFTS